MIEQTMDGFAVIGLGPIGHGVASRLVAAGERVVGVDASPERASAWARISGRPALISIDELDLERTDVLIIAVRLAEQMHEVVDSLAARTVIGQPLTLVVLTTLSTHVARELPARLPSGWSLLECPVSGGEWGARDGTLSVYLAGAEGETVERMLAAISSRRFRFERFGDPASAKLLNNALAAYNAVATARFVEIAAQLQLDPRAFLDIVRSSSGQSWMADHFEDFPADLLFKDVRLLRGESLGDFPVVALDGSVEEAEDSERLIAVARGMLQS